MGLEFGWAALCEQGSVQQAEHAQPWEVPLPASLRGCANKVV